MKPIGVRATSEPAVVSVNTRWPVQRCTATSNTLVTRVLSGFTNVLLLAVGNGTISAFGVTVVLVAVGASGPVGARSADTLTGAGGPGATGRDAGKRSMPFGA